MTTPMFTVLCATYNQAQFLEEALDSVVSQTEQDYEIVVVDDGSTDETPEVLERWRARQPTPQGRGAIVVRTVNGGQSAAYEHGFAHSTGRYICLLDSDDRFGSTKLEQLAAAVAERPEAGLLMHPLRVIDVQGRDTGMVRPRAAALSDGDIRSQMRQVARLSAPGASGLALRRDVFAGLLPFPTKAFPFAADAYLAFGAACREPLAALPEALADYRMQPGGQYLRRMSTPDGIARTVAFQETIAEHFGLRAAMARNSFFLRNQYAASMFADDRAARRRHFRALLLATARDTQFTPAQKSLLLGFWTATRIAGAKRFPQLWLWFQKRQTGWDRLQ